MSSSLIRWLSCHRQWWWRSLKCWQIELNAFEHKGVDESVWNMVSKILLFVTCTFFALANANETSLSSEEIKGESVYLNRASHVLRTLERYRRHKPDSQFLILADSPPRSRHWSIWRIKTPGETSRWVFYFSAHVQEDHRLFCQLFKIVGQWKGRLFSRFFILYLCRVLHPNLIRRFQVIFVSKPLTL